MSSLSWLHFCNLLFRQFFPLLRSLSLLVATSSVCSRLSVRSTFQRCRLENITTMIKAYPQTPLASKTTPAEHTRESKKHGTTYKHNIGTIGTDIEAQARCRASLRTCVGLAPTRAQCTRSRWPMSIMPMPIMRQISLKELCSHISCRATSPSNPIRS